MRNFAITAMGRSGTKFLAENMNKSKKWTVTVPEIQKRFNRDFYGEVNSYLRFIIDKIECEKKGIILRNPIDLWLSITSWHSQERWASILKKKWNQDFRDIQKAIPHLLNLVESGNYHVISFRRMTTDLGYLRNIFEYFGVDNVEVDEKMLTTKVNAAPERLRTSWEDFDHEIRAKIMRLNDEYLRRTEKIFMRD